MADFSIKKTTVECYKIRHATGLFWADINIDAAGKQGRIQIASDFGDWQNYWGACGSGFKQFLIGLDIHYFADKVGADHYFDLEKTMTSVKKDIIESRRAGNLTAEVARSAFDELKELEDCNNADVFAERMYMSNHLSGVIYDGYPDLCYDVTPGFKMFWQEVWPIFINALKSELAATTV